MRIKKVTGATLKIATDKMREELGEDAIILDTRKIAKSDGLNPFGRDEFEITAAIDDEILTAQADAFANHLAVASAKAAAAPSLPGTLEGLQKIATRFEHRKNQKEGEQSNTLLNSDGGSYESLKQEVLHLRALMEGLTSKLAQGKTEESLSPAPRPNQPRHEESRRKPKEGEECVTVITANAEERMMGELEEISLREEPGVLCGATKVIALVGPPDVDKTNTFVRMAAVQKIRHRQDVAMISAATYRLTAIERLRTFSGMMDIPLEIVYRASEMKEALACFQGKDVVLIDTVGKGQGVHLVHLPTLGQAFPR